MDIVFLSQHSIPTLAHTMLFAYVAWALGNGARTIERKLLARACAFYALYSGVIGAAFSLREPHHAWPAALCLVFFVEGTAQLVALARQIEKRQPLGVPWWMRLLLATTFVGGVLYEPRLAGESADDTGAKILGVCEIMTFVAAFGSFASATLRSAREGTIMGRLFSSPDRDARASRQFMVALCFPFVSGLVDAARGFGAPMSPLVYRSIRDVAVLLFALGLVFAFLNHAREQMSLQLRFSVGTLTIVLSVIAITTEVTFAFVSGPAIGVERAVASALAVRLAGVTVGAVILVLVALPMLYRGGLLVPLERLLGGVRDLERGQLDVRIEVGHDDEIGFLTSSFNNMAEGLAEGRRDLVKTNEELRRQIAARSRDMADLLDTVAEGSGIEIGTTVGNVYRIERFVGKGGMGVVYEVSRADTGARLAMKVMTGSSNREDAVRFTREAEIAAQLDHPHLVSVTDVGVWQGAPYLVMQLVDGGSLEDRRSRFGDRAWAMPLLLHVARGLAALHARNVIHRDLKPANVLLHDAMAKISDFGIASRKDIETLAVDAPTWEREGLTRSGTLLGTLVYMAPELVKGMQQASASSDVYAFGVMAYEMLTREAPYEIPSIMLALARKPLPPAATFPDDLPSDIRRALGDATSSDPSQRPTAARLVALLAEFERAA